MLVDRNWAFVAAMIDERVATVGRCTSTGTRWNVGRRKGRTLIVPPAQRVCIKQGCLMHFEAIYSRYIGRPQRQQ